MTPLPDVTHLPLRKPDDAWRILCDFDGTISLVDVTDALLESFARDGWQRLEDSWRNGEIGSQQCMAAQVELICASKAELDSRIADIAIDPDFDAFVELARASGLPVWIVSDGLDYVIESILHRHGITELPVIANKLLQTDSRSWKLDFPHAHEDCRKRSGTCKCEQLHNIRRNGRILYIGDGASDFCVSHQADFVLAKGDLIDYVSSNQIPYAEIDGFGDAVTWLDANLRSGFVVGASDQTGSQPKPSRLNSYGMATKSR